MKKIRIYILNKIANYRLRHGNIDGYNEIIRKIRDLRR